MPKGLVDFVTWPWPRWRRLTIFISPLATPAGGMFGCNVIIVPYEEAISRLWADHDLLFARAEGLTEAQLPASLLLHRLRTVRDALLAELAGYSGQAWTEAGRLPELAQGVGGLAQRVWTVPGQLAFWHAAIHLNQLPQETSAASQRRTPDVTEQGAAQR